LRVYRKIWARCRQAWDGERWIRITDENDAPKFLGINQVQQDQMTGQVQRSNVVAEIDVDIIMEEGPDTVTMNEELLQTFSQMGEVAMGPMGKVMIELSGVPNKERLLKLIDDAQAPPPEVAELNKRMAKLEEMLKAATIDEKIASVESKRADTLAKLMAAATPQQQQTDEFGYPSGPPPAQPNLAMAFQAMQAFPLNYGQPTVEQMAMQSGQQQPQPQDQMQGGPQQGPMPGQPPQMPQQGMEPNEIMPPEEQMTGGLPLDPQLAGMPQ
jgi:hypothetical protein